MKKISETKNNFNIAISKGKAFMKKSLDTFHDFHHARDVEQLALKIFKDQQQKELTSDLVSMAAYWHDVYKASRRFRLDNVDGKASKLMTKKNLRSILPKKDLKKVLGAVANHDQVIKYTLFPKSFPPLSKILIEADMLDMFNINRWKRGVNFQNMSYIQKFLFSFFEIVAMSLVLPKAFTFTKSREIYKKRSKEFWKFFLLKEKYFFKVIGNKV